MLLAPDSLGKGPWAKKVATSNRTAGKSVSSGESHICQKKKVKG